MNSGAPGPTYEVCHVLTPARPLPRLAARRVGGEKVVEGVEERLDGGIVGGWSAFVVAVVVDVGVAAGGWTELPAAGGAR